MNKIKYLFLFLILVSCISLYGCGYTTRAYVGPYKSIYTAPFRNKIDISNYRSEGSDYKTYYPLLESTITQAIVNRFIFDGSLKSYKEENADLILKGELISYQRGALKYADNNEDVDEYRVTLIVNISLYRTSDGELIWQKDGFAGDSSYFTTGSYAKSEKAALDDAISDLARRVVEAVVEAW